MSKNEYEIESGVEIPPPSGGRPPSLRYPWDQMGHMDSVVIPWTDADRERIEKGGTSQTAARSSADSWLRNHRPGWKLVGRRVEGEHAHRYWFVDPSQNGADS